MKYLNKYPKILSVEKSSVRFVEQVDNPKYDKEFDRLDDMGVFSADAIVKKLSDMDISPIMEKTFEKPMSDISFVDLFYSLYDMKLEELKVLSRNISSNDTMKNLVGLVIASRSKFSR